MPITTKQFGFFKGKQVYKYTITNNEGMEVSVISYGATVTHLWVPDAAGVKRDVVLGFETLDGYIAASKYYIGSICGRYANRVGGAKFSIGNETYTLAQNERGNNLHGGIEGFDKVVWDAEILHDEDAVVFSYLSKDGEEGFPGNLSVKVTYSVQGRSLQIDYKATTDKDTVLNLTSHCYFNLSGGKDIDVLQHDLQLNANSYVVIDQENIPTGEIRNVAASVMDFSTAKNLKTALGNANGYDHTWVIDDKGNGLKSAGILTHPESGLSMEVHTTCPGIHFYSGGSIPETFPDVKQHNAKSAGLCLETQHFPDSPNHSHFPSTLLRVGEVYEQTTVYRFNS